MEQQAIIRVVIPRIELEDAVKLKQSIDELIADYENASTELSVRSLPPVPSPRRTS